MWLRFYADEFVVFNSVHGSYQSWLALRRAIIFFCLPCKLFSCTLRCLAVSSAICMWILDSMFIYAPTMFNIALSACHAKYKSMAKMLLLKHRTKNIWLNWCAYYECTLNKYKVRCPSIVSQWINCIKITTNRKQQRCGDGGKGSKATRRKWMVSMQKWNCAIFQVKFGCSFLVRP